MLFGHTIAVVDIRGDVVRRAVVRVTKRNAAIVHRREAAVSADSKDDESGSLAAAVREVFRNGPHADATVLLVPSTAAVTRQLTVPFRGQRRLRATVPFELEPHLAVPVERLAIDHVPLSTGLEGTTLLAVGVAKEFVEHAEQALSANGIELDCALLETDARQALNARMRETPRAGDVQAIVHVEADYSEFSVYDGDRLAYLRQLSFGRDAFENLGSKVLDQLQQAIRSYETAARDTRSISVLTITGQAVSDTVREVIESEMDLELEFFDPAAVDTGSEADARWAMSIGAAVAAASNRHTTNFSSRRTRVVNRKLRRQLMNAGAVALLIFAAHIAGVFAAYRENAGEIERASEGIHEILRETYPDQADQAPSVADDNGAAGAYALLEKLIEEEMDSETDNPVSILAAPTLLDLLNELADAMPNHRAEIENITLSRTGEPEITVTGEVRNSKRFGSALDHLRSSELLELDENQLRRSSAGGRETFVVVLNF